MSWPVRLQRSWAVKDLHGPARSAQATELRDLDHVVMADAGYRVIGSLEHPARFVGSSVYSPGPDGDRLFRGCLPQEPHRGRRTTQRRPRHPRHAFQGQDLRASRPGHRSRREGRYLRGYPWAGSPQGRRPRQYERYRRVFRNENPMIRVPSAYCFTMTPNVSVPEKTPEHRASLCVAHRYRPLAAQRWPVNGVDTGLRALPAQPGKAIQLELKTITPAGPGRHKVNVDLGQLWEYSQKPLARQPFHAFPGRTGTESRPPRPGLTGKTRRNWQSSAARPAGGWGTGWSS